ncbi:hypothetical protein S4A8_06253 [Salinisphaera sp. S4-8]|uniref:SHOCT domain-containing protein n=1 Tax=Salinisphaera sp. S4-8 TaxID=633357 RepID=UPI00333E56DA
MSTQTHNEPSLDELAERYGFSREAVGVLKRALAQGHGSMASFNHPELGGAGQWMRGGLLMIEDAFNHELKARIDALCHALGEHRDVRAPAGAFASQHQFQSSHDTGGDDFAYASWADSADWWPTELGSPNATGQQNDLHYAYFAGPRRLALRKGNQLTIHDTGEHRITGISQQQGNDLASLRFTSQHGPVALASLPVVERSAPASDQPGGQGAPCARESADAAPRDSQVFDAIERLGDLKAKGLLSDEEFAAKKQELLARL